jgi:hypothetical protein
VAGFLKGRCVINKLEVHGLRWSAMRAGVSCVECAERRSDRDEGRHNYERRRLETREVRGLYTCKVAGKY